MYNKEALPKVVCCIFFVHHDAFDFFPHQLPNFPLFSSKSIMMDTHTPQKNGGCVSKYESGVKEV
jgi:hypothetical protein